MKGTDTLLISVPFYLNKTYQATSPNRSDVFNSYSLKLNSLTRSITLYSCLQYFSNNQVIF